MGQNNNPQKSWITKTLYVLRNIQNRRLFYVLEKYCRGQVLDIGGWDFYTMAKKKNIQFTHWTALDISEEKRPDIQDETFTFICGDGCNMPFPEKTFDTVLNIQVLEHVFEPIRMVK